VTGPGTLLWPGGPPAVGQAGRGFFALATVGVGAGVGRAVGLGVGWTVGCAVGCAVGRGVGATVGRAVGWTVGGAVACGVGWAVGCAVGRGVGAGVAVGAGVGPPPGPSIGGTDAAAGVGVGPTATSGLLGTGVADGTTDGVASSDPLGSGDTAACDPDGPVGWGAPDSDDPGVVAFVADGLAEPVLAGAADGFPPAIPVPGWAGATKPAVSATVARTRFRRPMATTRRARWAEVTTTGGLLQAGQRGVLGDGPMVAPGPLSRILPRGN
jgi:hypothetical protein